MIQIRPVSDLRNKFPEIETLEKYADITDDIEMKLDEADFAAEVSDVRYTHEEVFGRLN